MKIEERNYIDDIIKENLSDVRINTAYSWKEFNEKFSSVSVTYSPNFFRKITHYSTFRLISAVIILLSVTGGSYILLNNFDNIKGLKPSIINNDTTIKRRNSYYPDTLNMNSVTHDHTADPKTGDIKIKIRVPIHKNIIVKKKIILKDTVNN